jgi:competence protein ComEA
MLTRAEKGYLALTFAFLAAGSGIKAYRHASVRLGPFPETAPISDTVERAAGVDSGTAAGVDPDPSTPSAFDSMDSAASGTDPAVSESSSAGSGSPAGGGDGRVEASKRAGKPAFTGKADVNRSDAAGLTRVKGIGAKTAEAIVRYRKEHGPFRDLRELLQVKGIGEKKLEKLAPHLIL